MRRPTFLAWLACLSMACLGMKAHAAEAADQPDRNPQTRLISLAPSLTELVWALGFDTHLVGRSDACDYPPAVSDIPVVGRFGRPNWEALTHAKPDVVIATDLEKPGIRKQLEQRGVQVLLLPCESWDELRAAATAIGDVLDNPARADDWVRRLDERLTALHERVTDRWQPDARPGVYIEVWGRPVTSVGGNAFLHDVVQSAGGRNIAANMRGRYPAVSSEWVIRENPDVILLAYMLADMQAADAVKKRIGWSNIAAIREDRIIDHIHPDLLLRPGPRLIDGAESLADALHELMGVE